jgi:chromatin remodeling complex protein RSC6
MSKQTKKTEVTATETAPEMTTKTPKASKTASAPKVAQKETAPAPSVSATPSVPVTPKTKAPKVAATKESAPALSSAPATPKAKVQKEASASAPAPKAKVQKVAAAKEATPVETSEAVADAVDASAVAPCDFTAFMSKLQQVSTLISSLKSEFRSLEKKASRELKTANKASAKRKRKTGNRSPSGFVKPTLISKELALFLGKTEGSEMARTEVTREINAYIRTNSLQDKENGRRINADSKLSSLLKLNEGDELTYFNLQRYMSPHFAKTSAVAPVVVA